MRHEFSALSRRVIGCAIEVHSSLGPGLLESIYKRCLAAELQVNAIKFRHEVEVPVTYKGLAFDSAYRADFLVENQLVVELKSAYKLLPVHRSQTLTYMRLLGAHEGLLLNFWVPRLKDDGIHRLIRSTQRT